MLTISESNSIAGARLKDAEALLLQKRYDGAAYLGGYAVEIALKARIARTLKWAGFPATRGEFEGLQSFKTHDLQLLPRLSGWKGRIKAKLPAEWLNVSQWNSESRYLPPGSTTEPAANHMIQCEGHRRSIEMIGLSEKMVRKLKSIAGGER